MKTDDFTKDSLCCGACRFFVAHLAEERNGEETSECRRYPPATNLGARRAAFPIVGEADFCGEFRAKEA